MILEDSEIPKESNNGIIYLNISLYFAILAFFIVLTVVSPDNTKKSHEILSSVKNKFTTGELNTNFNIHQKASSVLGTTFKDELGGFADSQKQYTRFGLAENKVSYRLETENIYFFSEDTWVPRAYFNKFSNDVSDLIIKNEKHTGASVYLVLRFTRGDLASYDKIMERLAALQKMLDQNKVTNIKLSAVPWDARLDKKDLEQILIIFSKNDF